jgi:hypothetical protein
MVTLVITEMVCSPMLRSPLARGVPRLGREGGGDRGSASANIFSPED